MTRVSNSCDSAESEHDALLRAVAHAPHAVDALDQLALTGPLGERLGPTKARTDEPAPGSVLDDRYRIDSKIGAGGMGVVFAATHTQTHRRVALKWMREEPLVRSERERTAARLRFAREARLAASIRHPNVVDVYDASREGEHPYLVMELLEGETLGARLRRARLSWDALLALLLPAMEGVAALHRQGVLHRDLKPDNVFLERLHGATQPKVLDFGVAALHERALDGEASLTREGAIVGTPGYMPLEQLRGARTLDPRVDVYALGVIAYEALTGERPFHAHNAADHAALLASTAPRDLGERVPALRGARARAVMKALAREPSDRHDSVAAFAHALRTARPQRLPELRRVTVLLALTVLPASHASRPQPAPLVVQSTAPGVTALPVPSESVPSPRSAPIAESVLPQDVSAQTQLPAASSRARAPRRTATALTREDFSNPRARPQPSAVDPATRLARDDFE